MKAAAKIPAEPQEIEIKFSAAPQDFEAIKASPLLSAAAAWSTQSLRSVYYDTQDAALHAQGITFRVRMQRAKPHMMGFKSKAKGGGPFGREEHEVPLPGARPDITLFDAAVADRLWQVIGEARLGPRLETIVERTMALLQHGGSIIEVALDKGHIAIGKTQHPLGEVELELRSGHERDLCDLALGLATALPLRLDFVSKGQKGITAWLGSKPSAVKATALEIDGNASLQQAIMAVISNSLGQITANWAGLQQGMEPELIHQFRVGLRRLRVALAVFAHGLADAGFEDLRSRAKTIQSALNLARECDVLIEIIRSKALPDANQLLVLLEQRRSAAYAEVEAAIASQAATRLVIELRKLIASGMGEGISKRERKLLRKPARAFARKSLARLNAKALKRGERLAEKPDEELHDLRIALKNLRYGSEFFASLFDLPKRAKATIRAIAELQDVLGRINDGVGARHLLGQFAPPLPAEAERAIGHVLGWHARDRHAAHAELAQCWKHFTASKPFWD
jgi:triphosphatase